MLPELKKNCTTKFDESLDLSFQINNKQKKSEVNIRTVVNLPGGTGKKIKVAVKLKGGSKEPGRNIVASISKKQLESIAKEKMNDLNANDIEEAVKIIAGSARSMGIEVKE